MNIVLVGHKATGKTTIGKLFAEKYKYEFIDTDYIMIQNSCYKSISELYNRLGETSFREYEYKKVKELLSIINKKTNKKYIVATGGGILSNKENINYLQQIGTIIYLNTPKKLLLDRIKQNKKQILFNKANIEAKFNDYYNTRSKIYITSCDNKIDTVNKNTIEIVKELKQHVSNSN